MPAGCFAQKVNKASKVIYRDNAELLNLFLFPRGSEDDAVFNLLGNVKDAANAPVKGVEIAVIGTGIGSSQRLMAVMAWRLYRQALITLRLPKPGITRWHKVWR